MTATVTIDDNIFARAAAKLQTHDPVQVVRRAVEAVASQPETVPPQSKPFDFERTLAAAEALGDLSDEEFDAFQRAMNRPLPPAWSE